MIQFQLISTVGIKFNQEVYEVLVPTPAGTIATFRDHMPLISAAAPGVVAVRKKPTDSDEHMEHFAVSGGVVEVDGEIVRFLSDEVTTPEVVSEAEAEAALERAQELIAGAHNQVALHEAKRALHHSSARLHVARLKKRHHH